MELTLDCLYTRLVAVLIGYYCTLLCVRCGPQEVCSAEDFHGQCGAHEAILMEHALYGRMRIGRCVETNYGQLGCQDDVLLLADKECSGRQQCVIDVPNVNLKSLSVSCPKDIASYLEIGYTCVEVAGDPECSATSPSRVLLHEGYLSSTQADSPACRHHIATWRIQAKPGQTIHLWLLDFGALSRQKSGLFSSCAETSGYIVERSLGVNHTLCGGLERRTLLYKSKTNTVEVVFVHREEDQPGYMVHYTFSGCSDLTPPAEAWYKREGSEAVIGCKSNDRVWRLHCHGNTWDGVVGNCSTETGSGQPLKGGLDFSFSSVIFLTGVVCAAFLLVIVVVVAGSVYIKKQSIKHEIKLRSEYSAATLSPSQYYTVKSGYDVTSETHTVPTGARGTENQPLVQIWDQNNPTMTVRTAESGLRGNVNPQAVMAGRHGPQTTTRGAPGDLMH